MNQIQTVSASRSLAWYQSAWDLYKVDWLSWGLMTFALGISSLVIGWIPFIGSAIFVLILPIMQAGMLYAAQKATQRQRVSISDLFVVFRDEQKRNALFVVGAFMLGVALIVSIMLGGSMLATSSAGLAASVSDLPKIGAGSFLVGAMGLLFMTMLFLFAPALVLFDNLPPIEAIKQSFSASLKNFTPIAAFMVIYLIASFIGAIPALLGLLVVIPVSSLALYTAYNELFD